MSVLKLSYVLQKICQRTVRRKKFLTSFLYVWAMSLDINNDGNKKNEVWFGILGWKCFGETDRLNSESSALEFL